MIEALTNFFAEGDFWAVLVKVLLTALLSAGIGLIGTLIGKVIAKNKNSRITKYAQVCVKAAEQKFPNEGKKMGPEKMAYVMDQLAIKFPKIKENTYLYNIAESAVYELNRENQKQTAIEEFKEKYGEDPLAVQEEQKDIETTSVDTEIKVEEVVEVASTVEEKTVVEQITKLSSF